MSLFYFFDGLGFYSKEKLSFMLFDLKIVPNYCLVSKYLVTIQIYIYVSNYLQTKKLYFTMYLLTYFDKI